MRAAPGRKDPVLLPIQGESNQKRKPTCRAVSPRRLTVAV